MDMSDPLIMQGMVQQTVKQTIEGLKELGLEPEHWKVGAAGVKPPDVKIENIPVKKTFSGAFFEDWQGLIDFVNEKSIIDLKVYDTGKIQETGQKLVLFYTEV